MEPASLVELLRGRALHRPDRRAYVFLADGETDEAHLTRVELERRARSIGAWLQNAGASGQRVVLLYPPGLEYIAAFFGCLYAGAVAVPVYPPRKNQRLSRLQSIVEDSQASFTLTTSRDLSRGAAPVEEFSPLKKLRWVATDTLDNELARQWQDPRVSGETLAFLQYTSGSTAEPKGVMVSHANLLHNARMMEQACEHTEDSTFVSWLPLYHDMGLIGNVLQSLYFGATCVLMSPAAFLQRPLRWLHAISRYRAHTSGAPNFAYELCARRATAEDLAALDLSSWEVAFNGAEPISGDSLERFAETFAPCGFRRESFFPCYGLAEATLFVSGGPKKSAPVIQPVRADELKSNRVVADAGGPGGVQTLVGCGQTLAGQKVVVTNPETRIPCPQDVVGEVWLSGPSVARGYWNKPEETEQYFRARHADTGDGPYLRTGDLGFIKDGELFITGRLKDLIIVRGLNHYPQDIEQTVEECHPALRPGCGAAFSVAAAGEEQVVVVQEVTPRHKGLDLNALDGTIREAVALKHELQLYAVVLIAAGSIPKTSSGKIRRRACRALFLEGGLEVLNESKLEAGAGPAPDSAPSAEAVLAAPPEARRELLEAYLEDCVSRLFRVGRSQLARDQSLSKLGLDSLAAVELSADIAEKFGAEVSHAELLCGPSIAEVADRILRATAADGGRAGGVERGALPRHVGTARREDPLPLSSTQQGLWFLNQLVKDSAFYNIPVAVRLKGTPNLLALEKSLSTIESRHESLRTRFATVGGRPVQVVMPPRILAPELVELDAAGEGDREAELSRLLGRLARRPFNLSEERLVRATLIRLGADEHVLLILLHHIVADGWSVGVLMRELMELYDAHSQQRDASLPELKIQYADYVMWQRALLESEGVKGQLAYWRRQLGGHIPVLELPTDYPRPAAPGHRGAAERFLIDREVTEGLRALGRQEGATLFMVLTAGLNALLHRYTGQEDIVVGTPVANRTRREFEPLIGCFVNTLALRMSVEGGETFRNLLRAARRVMLDASANQDVPFERLVEELQPDRSLSHTPIFQVMIASQNSPARATEMGGLTLGQTEVDTGTAKFDLLLFVEECEQGLKCSIEYSSEVFAAERIARMAGHLRALLSSAASDPDLPLRDLRLLSEAEERLLLRDWNETAVAAVTAAPVHRLIEAQAARTPEAVAVVDGSERVTYGELERMAAGVAAALRREGVGAESVVGVLAGRGAGLVAGLLGVLKAGGAYVPLDPTYPRERLSFMLDDAGVSVLLTEQSLLGSLPRSAARVICLDTDCPEVEGVGEPDVEVADNNLAYVIYTSGSTGRPKGVAIEHRSAAALLHWAKSVFSPEELSGVLASTSICFDLSVFEIFLPLSCGGKIILAEHALQLPALQAAAEVKLINTVPSAMNELLALKAVPPSAVTVNLAGEPLSGALARQVLSETRAQKLYNLYGPSETTTYSTFALVSAGADERPNIGRPIANTRVYILDRHLRPVPVGVSGELYIGGEGLARGYLNRPQATAEKFIPDPFGDAHGRRMYKTGDLARYLPDGNIEFLGRLDNQVKVRGFRIELGEVQSALLQHTALKDVLVKDDGEGAGRRLVAYVVGRQREVPGAGELRRFLAERLPDFMIPSVFVALEKMPLTPNGKIDRRALPRPDDAGRGGENAFAAPRNHTEELLASIWADLLGLRQVGIHDNFFDLGGHSLLATQLVSRLREALQIEMPLRTLFSALTVAELAPEVESLRRARRGGPLPPVERAPREERPPLSFAQQRLWLLDRFEPSNPFYNISGGVRLEGPLDTEALHRALNEIVRRHEALRTCFASDGGRPYQSVVPEISLPLPVVDLRHLEGREREMSDYARQEARRPFDLERAPLLRVSLVRLAEREHVLLLTAHHIAFDGSSIELFIKELGALYEAFRDGRASPLAEPPIQYVDYTSWQRRWVAGELLEAQLSYWKRQLGGELPVLELPSDWPRPPVQTFRGDKHRFRLDGELLDSVRSLGYRNGATMFMTLLAAFKVLLYRYTGQRDILVGSPISNRNRLETEGLIGFFVNTLVLRTGLSGELSFRELLGRVRETALDAYAHQDVPFERLIEELQPDRDMSHTPLFQVMFSLRRSSTHARELPGLSLTQFEVDSGTTKVDLALQLEETAEGVEGYFEYSSEVFRAERIARMAGHLRALLSSAASDPDLPLRDLRLLTPAEERLLLRDWNETAVAAVTTAPVHRLIEAQAARTPEAVAVVDGSERVTYGELERMAAGVAAALRREGVGAESVVGVLAGRGVGLVAGLLGVLKAGGAYVPLDPTYPRERLSFMLDDAGASVLLSERRLADSLPAHAGKTLYLEDFRESPSTAGDENPGGEVSPENLAYVIYTSGSTGRPKGVAVRHAGLVNLIDWHRRVYAVSPADRAAHMAGLEFDASVWELWPYLTAGASIHIPDEETRLSPSGLVEWLTREGVTVCFLPTPLAEAALREDWPGETKLRALLTGGDRLQHRPGESLPFKLFNHYGPTENTVVATAAAVAAVSQAAGVPDIGRPISNVRVYLLDPNLRPVPVGVPGELCIGGDGLARGYLRRPALTAEKFIPDPFGDGPGGRLYKTGDLARYLPEGSIEFLGRMDDQVKVRGFRIELADVESALREHEDVREAVVLAREDVPGEKSLAAYVVPARGRVLTGEALREHLRQRLPEYMIPPVFVALEDLPLTPNGKVDRKALPAPPRGAPARPGRAAGSIAEEALAAVWAEVLDGEQPGPDDNFFEIGGHSLRAAQVMSRVREVFGVDLPLRSLFESPTVGGLLKLVEQARREGAGPQSTPLRPAPAGAELPLSFAQERLWFLHQLHPESHAYNISGAVRVSGATDPALLEQVINEIVRRHASLRTTFQTVRGRPVQLVAPHLRLSLPTLDLSELPPAERQAEIQRLATEQARRPFDLTRGPLLRGTLVLLGGGEQLLLLTIHHIVSDGWSVRVFVRELGALRESFAAGEPSPLAELPIQYADFAYWQRQWLEGEALQTELDFWKRQLADAPPALELPTNHPRPPVQSLNGGRHLFELPEDLSEEVRRLSRGRGVTTFMTFNAALQVLLQHYARREDIVVGADIVERDSTELESLIGLFVNQLVLRVNAAGVRTFGELLKRVREVTLAAYDHRRVPFHKIVEALRPELDLSRNPLFQVMLVFDGDPVFDGTGGVEMAPLQMDEAGSPFDFSLVITEAPGGFRGAFRYSTDLFEAATAARMAEHFQAILRAVVARPDIELEGLRGMLAQSEQEVLLTQARALRETRSRMFGRIKPRTTA